MYVYDPNKLSSRQRNSAIDIAKYCPRLTKFHGQDWQDVTVISALARGCPMLEDVQLGGSTCTSETIVELSRHCTSLKTVCLDHCEGTEESLVALVRSNPGLESFTIHGEGASDRFLDALALHCPNFAELSISNAFVSERAVFAFLTGCHSLKRFRILNGMYESDLDRPVLEAPRTVCKSLEVLHLSGMMIDTGVVQRLLAVCPNLTHLKIWGSAALSDLEALQIGARCPLLRKLMLGCNEGLVTDKILVDIVEKCARLTGLEIPDCEAVTTAGLSAVVRACPKLETLELNDSAEVTDEFLTVLAESCGSLQVLHINRCSEVTDTGVSAVLQGCPALVVLGVVECCSLSEGMKRDVTLRYPEPPQDCSAWL
jgi:hypothetical protein